MQTSREVLIGGNDRHRLRTVITAFCWNIWREKNIRLFNNKYHSIQYCMRLTVYDFIIWADVFSDEESLHL